jgi:tetratricopeptide (TPR) repeat protein
MDFKRKLRFSLTRFFLLLLLFILVVGGFLAVKIMESFFFKGLKPRAFTTYEPRSVLNEFSDAKNQTDETARKEVVYEASLKPSSTFTRPASNANATITSVISAKIPISSSPAFTTKISATNELQSKSKPQSRGVKPLSDKSFLADISFKEELIEKTLLQEDMFRFDSEEKMVGKRKRFSLFQGEKKLENLLLKAEEETARGNYQLAKFFYEKYLEEKKDPRVYNNYGGVLFLLGNYEEAERAFAAALSLEPNPVFKFNLILTKIKLNQTKEACQMFKKFQKDLEVLEEGVFLRNICFS